MPRYVQQWDLFSCGPIGVLNARKWAGRRTTVKRDYKKLRRRTNAEPAEEGCTLKAVDLALRSCQELIVRRTRNRTARRVRRHLASGGAAIVSVRALFLKKRGFENHLILLSHMSRSRKSVAIVNRVSRLPDCVHGPTVDAGCIHEEETTRGI